MRFCQNANRGNVWLGCCLAASILVVSVPSHTIGAERHVLVEDFTANWCAACADSGAALDLLMEDYPNEIVVLEMHVNDQYDIPWGNTIRPAFYGVSQFSDVWFDGVTEDNDPLSSVQEYYDQYLGSVLDRLSVPTDVALALSSVHTGGHNYDVTMTVDLEAGAPQAETLRLYMMQAIDHWPAAPSYSRNTLRQAVETGYDVTLNPGETMQFVRSVALDAQSWARLGDTKLIAWAQEPNALGPAEVFNAAQLKINVLSGDFDGDSDVDGNDFLIWQREFRIGAGADADGDGDSDGDDFLIWQQSFGGGSGGGGPAVPEPASCWLVAASLAVACVLRRGIEI